MKCSAEVYQPSQRVYTALPPPGTLEFRHNPATIPEHLRLRTVVNSR